MRKPASKKLKKGAASIYIIVVTSLLFGVITIGFISLVTNELRKSSENSLSQSAYDSALAGVEDAKLALSEYYKCMNNDIHLTEKNPSEGGTYCENVLWYINNDAATATECDAVANILGRSVDPDKGVLIEETYGSNQSSDTTQSYTCIKLNTTPSDYRSYLSSTDTIRVIPLKPVGDAGKIKKIRLSWYSVNNGTEYHFNNVNNSNIVFNSLSESSAATPPTVAMQLYQTASEFNLTQFENSVDDRTDRGTLWLVPTNNGDGNNSIAASELVTSNKHNADQATHYGYKVNCSTNTTEEFACSAEIGLPNPVGGDRKTKTGTFLLVVSLPYGQPTTDFKVEMFTKDEFNNDELVQFDNVQVSVDSTGRANDVYSRVESRVEFYDVYFPFPEYALDLGSEDGPALSKDFWVTYNCWSSSNGSLESCQDSETDCAAGQERVLVDGVYVCRDRTTE